MSTENRIEELVTYIRTYGFRDIFLIQKKGEEFCLENKIPLSIVHCEKSRNTCTIYYDVKGTYSLIDFQLGRIKKENSLEEKLKLKTWANLFSQKIRSTPYHLEDMKIELQEWVKETSYIEEKEHFLKEFKVYLNFNKQVVVSYTELNGEKKKIKPILLFFEPVSIEQMYQFAKTKSMELWGRVFDGHIKIQNVFWVTQLGTYDSANKTIYFSAYQNGTQSREEIWDTLLHELVHWHLHTIGKPYSDVDFEFIEELLRVGGKVSKASYAQNAYTEYRRRKCVQENHDYM